MNTNVSRSNSHQTPRSTTRTRVPRSDSLPQRELPLLISTPVEWVAEAMSDVAELLNDHAHLERKAALNALDMMLRWPGGGVAPKGWCHILSTIAKDEGVHAELILRIMEERGVSFSRAHRSVYAAELHRFIRRGRATLELLDRLLVSGIIEARSCERFMLLANHCSDRQLKKVYHGLYSSEHGHYRVFLDLATSVVPNRELQERWTLLLNREAELLPSLVKAGRLHSWPSNTDLAPRVVEAAA